MSKMLLALSPPANVTQDTWSATFLHIPVEEGFISVAVQPCVVVWVEVTSISVLCIHSFKPMLECKLDCFAVP
jgi:hypothetical protein